MNLALLNSRVSPPHTLSGNPVFQGTQPNGCGMCAYLMPSDQQKNSAKSGTSFPVHDEHVREQGFIPEKGWWGNAYAG